MKLFEVLILAPALTSQDWAPRTADEILAVSLHAEAAGLYAEGKLMNAERKSLRSVALLEKSFGTADVRLAAPLFNLAAIYFESQTIALTRKTLARVIPLLGALPSDCELAVRTYQTLGAVELRNGDARQALEFDRKALAIL